MQHLDPHERPPDGIRNVYKKYQKMKLQDLENDRDIVDLTDEMDTLPDKVRVVRELKAEDLSEAFRGFAGSDEPQHQGTTSSIAVYEHEDMPGLHIIPTLLPPEIQQALLSRLLHRDLSNPAHLTNIHTHYNLSYPPSDASFFSLPPTSSHPVATPHDPSLHKPLTVAQLLNKKLRWMTLGGQYNWTSKAYPTTAPPPFPLDTTRLLIPLFPLTHPTAAIANFYSPGDTLSVHRDVAESSPTGLISLSLGCDAIFVIGTASQGEEGEKVLALRLRSGSAVYMEAGARFAWHGVPRIVGGTCPGYLESWPAGKGGDGEEYEEWKGWMTGKRVNLNVRQMWD